MHSLWARVRWADVAVGALAWCLFAGEWVLLDHLFPALPPDCVTSTSFACWDLRAPLMGLLSMPFWYAGWALLLRPCPWQVRWLTPFAVSYCAYRVAALCGSGSAWQVRVAALVGGYLLAATLMSAVNARAQAVRDGGS